MRSIAVMNQKGGCGKTITAINISAFLAKEQRRVLLVDMDPQGHATLGLQLDAAPPGKTISEVLLRESGKETPRIPDITRNVLPDFDLVPADIMLSAVPEKLSGVAGRENRLAEALATVRHQYHYIIIDCPPNIGLLTFNALMACSEAIVPMDPSFFSLHGIAKFLETLDMVARKARHEVSAHALITLYTGRAQFVREVVEDIRKHLGEKAFSTMIRFSVKLAEAASHGLPISEYCKRSAGFEDYEMLVDEIMLEERERPVLGSVAEQERISLLKGHLVPSAPLATNEGVIFTLEAPGAQRVQLAGDFNHWAPDEGDMECSGSIWQKIVELTPGRHRYRYVVDGRWRTDPLNAQVEPSPYGDYDSVVDLEGNRAGN